MRFAIANCAFVEWLMLESGNFYDNALTLHTQPLFAPHPRQIYRVDGSKGTNGGCCSPG